jgi:hypothetical protein
MMTMYGSMERLDQGYLHPNLEVQDRPSRPGIKPGPPRWEVSHSSSLLIAIHLLSIHEPAI